MSAQLAKAKVKAEVDAHKAVVHNAGQLLQLLRSRATAAESNGQLAFKRFAKNAQVLHTYTSSSGSNRSSHTTSLFCADE